MTNSDKLIPDEYTNTFVPSYLNYLMSACGDLLDEIEYGITEDNMTFAAGTEYLNNGTKSIFKRFAKQKKDFVKYEWNVYKIIALCQSEAQKMLIKKNSMEVTNKFSDNLHSFKAKSISEFEKYAKELRAKTIKENQLTVRGKQTLSLMIKLRRAILQSELTPEIK